METEIISQTIKSLWKCGILRRAFQSEFSWLIPLSGLAGWSQAHRLETSSLCSMAGQYDFRQRTSDKNAYLWPLQQYHMIALQSTHRAATADFWRTSHHDGKISPGWVRVGGARPPPFTLLPSRIKLKCKLQLRGQIHSSYFISTLYSVVCSISRVKHHTCRSTVAADSLTVGSDITPPDQRLSMIYSSYLTSCFTPQGQA